jgi:universal stress protein A
MDMRTILIPCDFSEYSKEAFTWAVAMAETWHARVLLVHVVPRPSYPPIVMGTYLMGTYFNAAEFEDRLLAEAEAQTQEFLQKTGGHTVPLDTQCLLGEPFSDICQIADQRRVDVIVMGSHGRTGLRHVLLGSVAGRVVRHAPCPVLVVRKTSPL